MDFWMAQCPPSTMQGIRMVHYKGAPITKNPTMRKMAFLFSHYQVYTSTAKRV